MPDFSSEAKFVEALDFRTVEKILIRMSKMLKPVEATDARITMLAPFIKKQIEDALNSTLLPLVSVLRSREEDEQKHRELLLALEEEKLALKREKLLFKRRRVARSQPAPPRASFKARSGSKKRHGLRVKSSAV